MRFIVYLRREVNERKVIISRKLERIGQDREIIVTRKIGEELKGNEREE